MQTNSPQIYELISKYDNIVIGSHTNPDGDAVGSSLGLALCLAIMGKKPIVLLEDYSCKYSFIKGKEYIFKEDYDSLEPQLFISLDCSSPDRLGRAESVFKRAAETMCIDHHISNKNFADYNIVLADSSSTCEVVYDIIKNFCVLNESIAEALYTGIVSDTSAFKHKSTSPATLEAAARLISLGIDFSKIQTDVLYSHSKEQTAVFLKAEPQRHYIVQFPNIRTEKLRRRIVIYNLNRQRPRYRYRVYGQARYPRQIINLRNRHLLSYPLPFTSYILLLTKQQALPAV